MKLCSRISDVKNRPTRTDIFQGFNQCEQIGIDGGSILVNFSAALSLAVKLRIDVVALADEFPVEYALRTC
jgi:hypothetical protein